MITLDTEAKTVTYPSGLQKGVLEWAEWVWTRDGRWFYTKEKDGRPKRLVLEMGGTLEHRKEWAEVAAVVFRVEGARGNGLRWRVTNPSDQLRLADWLGVEELTTEVKRWRMRVSAHSAKNRGVGPSSARNERRIR